ncbi:MAG TPA: cysteine hydrolase, partial [Halobacteriales archaeon]|nr:cysteine hydrolase [Halobacteriales archaeon]
VCVATTLYDAYDNGYDVTLLSDCSSTDLPELQKLTEKNVEAKFGTVCKSTDIEL